MAFTSTDRSLCNKLITDFPGLITPLNSAQGIITGHASTLDSALRSMAWSGTSAINSGIGTLNSTVGNAVPGSATSDMQSLKNFLDNCAFLQDNNPLATVLNTAKGVFGLIDSTLDSLYSTVPEFGVGKVAGYINDLLKGLGIPGGDLLSDIFKAADKLLQCLSTLCSPYDPYYSPYISSYTSQLQGLYTTMNIVDDPYSLKYGLFDYDTLFSNVGLTAPQISDINLVIDAVDTVKGTSITGIMDSIASVKDLLGEGGFFA